MATIFPQPSFTPCRVVTEGEVSCIIEIDVGYRVNIKHGWSSRSVGPGPPYTSLEEKKVELKYKALL